MTGGSLSTRLVMQSSSGPSIVGAGRREPCLIVGYDGSPAARGAAAWAARRAAPQGRLVLVHAAQPPGHWLPASILGTAAERESHRRTLIEELLEDADAALREIPLEAEIIDEDPAVALLDAARRHGAQEIVIGSHRRSGLERFGGEVATALAHDTTVPVLIVPLGSDPGEELQALGTASDESAVR